MPSQPETAAKIVLHNNFTIYQGRKGQAIIECARPQDWGNKQRYVYRTYYYEATIGGQVYAHHCYCWTDAQDLEEWQYPAFFAPCVAQLLMPGTPEEERGQRYLGEEDFWNDDWGPRPPYFDEFSEN